MANEKGPIPVNIKLFRPTVQNVGHLRQVKTLDTFEPSSTSFHEDGLFSVTTFGRVGSKQRDKHFAVIDIKVKIIHPFVYRQLVSLKSLYEEIMLGKKYAIFDKEEMDLVESDPLNGDTGYAFFMANLPIIKFKRSESEERKRKIDLVENAIKNDLIATDKILVMPAGYRDVEVDKNERVTDSEINDFYRRMLSVANSVVGSGNLENEVFNTSRNSLQNTFNALFDYLYNLLKGKTGIIEAKWARRAINDGTRNVITSIVAPVGKLGSGDSMSMNHCAFGLWQTMKGALPLATHCILTGFIKDTFLNGTHAYLTDPKTLNSEMTAVSYDDYDKWTTPSGINKLIDAYGEVDIRSRPIMIGDKYLGLVYRGPDFTYKFFRDIEELPKDFSREYVYPITLVELLYVSCFERLNKIGVHVTRFPYNGIRSCIPMIPKIITTLDATKRRPLNEQWMPSEEGVIADSYPSFGAKSFHYDSMSPHFSSLQGFGADFDGDKESAGFVYIDDSVEELHDKLADPNYYLATDGSLMASSIIDPVEMVFNNMTFDLEGV